MNGKHQLNPSLCPFVDAINDQASSLAKLSQDLAKEAIMAGVDLTLCGEISNYKNIVTQIKENTLKRISPQSNLMSSLSNLNGNRALRNKLNISTIDPPSYQPTLKSDKVLNPYRLGLDLTVYEYQRESNYLPINHQFGTGFNDGHGNTGYQVIHRGEQVLDPYIVGSDLAAYDNVELGNPCTRVNQFGTGFRDKPSNTDN